jgi:serine protease
MTVSRLPLAVALALAALLCVTSANAASATQSADKPATKKRSAAAPGFTQRVLDVKFAEGVDVRLRDNRLVSENGERIEALDSALARFPGVRITRLFASASEKELTESRQEARQESGRRQPDLNLYFRIRTKGATDTVALVNALGALDIVEVAEAEAKPAAPPVSPSFTSYQGYRTSAAGGGIDAEFAHTLTGGKGENVTVVDIEYSWNRSHEDLGKARLAGAEIKNGTPCDLFAADGVYGTQHGTAVLGELFGDSNTFGVSGLVPGATLRTVNAASVSSDGSCGYNLANAIKVAADSTVPGDVILIEQQLSGPNRTDPNSGVGYVPVEWNSAIKDAIRNATALNRIVIEPAGNGYQDLDSAVYNGWFSTNDSGAIMVGAGNAPGCVYGSDPRVTRGRLGFSNYGSRLDVQGWGSCVATTGLTAYKNQAGQWVRYGNLQEGADANAWYTSSFSGTSSASPIVAASAAILSSIAEERGTTLKPASLRSILKSTGQPQQFLNANAGRIGPLPDLRAAIAALGPTLTEAGHVVVEGSTLGATTVPVRQTWSSSGSTPTQLDIFLSIDSGAYVKQTQTSASAVFNLERNHDYKFAARAKDADGIWGDWAYGKKFQLGEYQEDYSPANPGFTAGWTRAAWQPASEGFVTVSGTAGDTVSFMFTGTNIAWVATKSTNRGEADVFIDDVFVKTVDLYSPTTTAQSIAFTKSWSASAEHKIAVKVRGTAGRPKVDVDAFVRLRDLTT